MLWCIHERNLILVLSLGKDAGREGEGSSLVLESSVASTLNNVRVLRVKSFERLRLGNGQSRFLDFLLKTKKLSSFIYSKVYMYKYICIKIGTCTNLRNKRKQWYDVCMSMTVEINNVNFINRYFGEIHRYSSAFEYIYIYICICVYTLVFIHRSFPSNAIFRRVSLIITFSLLYKYLGDTRLEPFAMSRYVTPFKRLRLLII